MKYIILLFTFLISVSPISIFAQSKSTTALEWSKDQGGELGVSAVAEVIGETKDGILVVEWGGLKLFGSKSPSLTLKLFDDNMKIKKTKEIKIKKDIFVRDFAKVVIMGEEIKLIITSYDRKNKQVKIFGQEIDQNTLSLTGEEKELGTVSFKGFWPQHTVYDFVTSEDRSKVLLYFDKRPQKKNDAVIEVFVLDEELNIVSDYDFTIPIKKGRVNVENCIVENDGNAHVLFQKGGDPSLENMLNRSYFKSFFISSYYAKGKNQEDTFIDIGDNYVESMRMALDDNGDIACAGFYGDKEPYHSVGLFWLKLDSYSREEVYRTYKEFGIDFFGANEDASTIQKLKGKIDGGKNIAQAPFVLTDLELDENGGALLVGEHKDTYTNIYAPASAGTEYTFGNIAVVKISGDGHIEWQTQVQKKQKNFTSHYCSYTYFIIDNKLQLVFNDSSKNADLEKGDKSKMWTPNNAGNLVVVSLDENGNQNKEVLTTGKEFGHVIFTDRCKQISENEFVVFTRNLGRGHTFFSKIQMK